MRGALMSEIEYEIRVLEINRKEIIEKLEKLGAKKNKRCTHEEICI